MHQVATLTCGRVNGAKHCGSTGLDSQEDRTPTHAGALGRTHVPAHTHMQEPEGLGVHHNRHSCGPGGGWKWLRSSTMSEREIE